MTHLKRRTFLTGFAAATASFATDSDRPLAEIIARHTQVRGGAAALDGVQFEAADPAIVEKGQVVNAHYRCNKPPSFRIDIFDRGKHVFCEGWDRAGPWVRPGDAPKARQGVPFNLYGLHAFPSPGNPVAPDGRERIGGVDHYLPRVNLKDRYQTFPHIDPQAWMIARRRDFRAARPDIHPVRQKLETQYSDFRAGRGQRFPATSDGVGQRPHHPGHDSRSHGL